MKLESILEPVAGELDQVEARLRKWAESDLPVVADAVGHIIDSGGKRLRPACLLFAAKLGHRDHREHRGGVTSGSSVPSVADVTELAAAVEIIHTASLIHDDIIDGAAVRRGAPTLHARWGQGLALLVGDLLYSRIFRSFTENGQAEALRAVAETVFRMVRGELAETFRRDDLSLTESDYLEIVGNKTGALFSCAAHLGAHAGGLPADGCERLRRYGEHLGRAYQMVDDVLDICEGEDDIGKPAGADLREGKMTLPVIHALAAAAARGDGSVADSFRERDRDGVCSAVWRAGSVAYTVERAQEAVRDALACIEGFDEGPGRRGLEDLARYVAFRGREAVSVDERPVARDPVAHAAQAPARRAGLGKRNVVSDRSPAKAPAR